MKTVSINLYSFSELSKKAKQKAIDYFSESIGEDNWHEVIYDDAETIGLKINSFDLYRNEIEGEFNLAANEVAQNIFNERGEGTETYKTAEKFMAAWQPVFSNYMDESHEDYESEESSNKLLNLEDKFLNDLLKDYRKLLQVEYDYQTSEEAIIETIDANDYLFFSDGKLARVTHYTGKHERAGIIELKLHGEVYVLNGQEVAELKDNNENFFKFGLITKEHEEQAKKIKERHNK